MVRYSFEIANAINRFLTDGDWHFSFDEERGVFKFNLSLKGVIKELHYLLIVREDGVLLYAISPLSADAENPEVLADTAEFITRANYGLNIGNFELDYRDGEVRYKVYLSCNGVLPTDDMIEESIFVTASTFRRYSSGLAAVLFSMSDPKSAIEKCESE